MMWDAEADCWKAVVTVQGRKLTVSAACGPSSQARLYCMWGSHVSG